MYVTPFDALLIALAVYRLTRLVTRDHLTHALRERVLEPALEGGDQPGASRLDRLAGWLAFLVSCPWCLSMWLSGALCGAYATCPDPTRTFTLILAAAAVAGLLLDRDRS